MMNKKILRVFALTPTLCLFLALVFDGSAAAPPREKIDLLIRGGTILTIDSQDRIIENGAVAIRGDQIVAVGTSSELDSRYKAGRTINAGGRLVMPGLVNAHNHAPMVLFRGIADDLALMDWLTNFIFPAGAQCECRIRALGDIASLRGNDPFGDHDLCRHVLL
jgi:hypothetical protein